MSDTLRNRHLDKLADAFFEHLDDNGDGGIGLDGKRPFGFSGRSRVAGSILDIVGVIPEGEDMTWSDVQEDYAWDLYGDLAAHLKRRWAELRAKS
jgi:hypothetical protein